MRLRNRSTRKAKATSEWEVKNKFWSRRSSGFAFLVFAGVALSFQEVRSVLDLAKGLSIPRLLETTPKRAVNTAGTRSGGNHKEADWSPSPSSFNSTNDATIEDGKVPQLLANIDINPEAMLANDVIGIHHDSKESKIVVTLHSNATCFQPYLMGRLCGPALVKLSDWTWINQNENDSVMAMSMEATYSAPVAGQYFLEVTALHCDD